MAADVTLQLSTLPGAEALAALSDGLDRSDPGAVSGMGRRVGEAAERLGGASRVVARVGAGIGDSWHGRGAEAFTRYAGEFARAGWGSESAVRDAAAEIEQVSRTLTGLRDQVAVSVSHALDAAAAVRAQVAAAPTTGAAAEADLVRNALAGPTSDARAAIARVEEELLSSARRIRALAADLTGLSRLAVPEQSGLGSSWTPGTSAGSPSGTAADVPVTAQSADDTSCSDAASPDQDDSDEGSHDGSDGSAGGDCGDDESSDRDCAEGGDDESDTDSGGSDTETSGTSSEVGASSESDGSSSYDTAAFESGEPGDGDTTTSDGAVDPSDAQTASTTDEPGSDADETVATDDGDSGTSSETSSETSGDSGSGDGGTTTDTTSDGPASDGPASDSDEATPDDGDQSDEEDQPATTTAQPSTPPPAPEAPHVTGGPSGRVGDWIREATGILAAQGVSTDKMDPDDIATIIDRESGGDPDAVNNSDSNAAKGTPSQGLMQTIGPTFDSYKLPGHDHIRDPIDNIIAGVRYAIARYGSVSEVPGVEALGRGASYVGY